MKLPTLFNLHEMRKIDIYMCLGYYLDLADNMEIFYAEFYEKHAQH